MLPLTIFWVSLKELSELNIVVGIVLLLASVGAFIEAIAALVALDDMFIEIEIKQNKEEE